MLKPSTDVDECALGEHDCDPNADCLNTAGGFQCSCRAGYSGDGVTCAGKWENNYNFYAQSLVNSMQNFGYDY